MIDYGGFGERLAACADRGARWELLCEVQREWGFVGAGNVWAPRGIEPGDVIEDLDDEWVGFDEADEDYGYAQVVPAAINEWFGLAENSFRQAPLLYWTHGMAQPCRFPDARTAYALRQQGIAEEVIPPFHGEFMGEYEGCFTWGYRESEAAVDDDPPVYILNSARPLWELAEALADGSDVGNMTLVARSVSEWALAFTVNHVPFGCQYLLGKLRAEPDKPGQGDVAVFDQAAVDLHVVADFGSLSDGQRAVVEEAYPEFGFLPWDDFGVTTFRGGPDVILRHTRDRDELEGESNGVLSIAARNSEAMSAAVARIGLELD